MNTMSLFARFIYSILLIALQSCVLFTFVGGRGTLARFPIDANYTESIELADKLVDNTYILRRFDKTGYDTGRRRIYYLKNDKIAFEVQFLGEANGWMGRNNFSEIALTFVGINGIAINSDQKLNKTEKGVYKEAVLKIDSLFIQPIRHRIRRI